MSLSENPEVRRLLDELRDRLIDSPSFLLLDELETAIDPFIPDPAVLVEEYERLLHNAEMIFEKRSVCNWDEVLAGSRAALDRYKAQLSEETDVA